MPEITELFNIDWRETSFVPRGDNPEARIVMWKDDPGLTDEEVAEVLEEVDVSETMKRANALALRKILDEPERFGEIADDDARLAAARSEVWAERPDLGSRDEALTPVVRSGDAPVEKGAPALAKRDAMVAELRKLYPEKSRAKLCVMALEEDPSIYEEYRRLTG